VEGLAFWDDHSLAIRKSPSPSATGSKPWCDSNESELAVTRDTGQSPTVEPQMKISELATGERLPWEERTVGCRAGMFFTCWL
jgi:hypothetical protein